MSFERQSLLEVGTKVHGNFGNYLYQVLSRSFQTLQIAEYFHGEVGVSRVVRFHFILKLYDDVERCYFILVFYISVLVIFPRGLEV